MAGTLVLGLLTMEAAMGQPSHAQAVSPRRLVEVADIGQPVISPDGRYVTFRVEQASVERNAYDSEWYVQRMDGASPPRRVGSGGVPLRNSAGLTLPSEAAWAPDGRWIYYRALLDGRIDVWRAAMDGSGAVPITHDAADVQAFRLGPDGAQLEYSVGPTREQVVAAEQAEYMRGTRVDGTVPLGQGLYRSGFVDGRLATQRFGQVWFDRGPLLGDVPHRWKVLELEGGDIRDLPFPVVDSDTTVSAISASRLQDAWRIARHRSDERVALLTRIGERDGLRDRPDVELSMLQGGNVQRVVRCTHELCTGRPMTSLQWRPGTDEVLFTSTDPDEGLAQSIYRWNVVTGAVHPVVRTRGLINGGRNGGRDVSSSCGASAHALVCVVAQAGDPPRLERIDPDTGARQVLFDPNAALAHDMKQVPVTLLRWTDVNGQTFTGQYFPATAKQGKSPPPLFVSYYRCLGFLRGGMGDEWPFASLAQHGISVLCINAAPYRVDALERYNNGLSATESAIRLLADRGEIDSERVGFGGLSFGSEVAMWLATESDLLAAISASSPVISPSYYTLNMLKGDDFFDGLQKLWQLGTPEETPERWKEISPTFRLSRIKAPILFQLAEQEFRQSVDYVVPLVGDGRADAWVFPHEPHQKFQPKHKLAVYERNLDWFRFWLQEFEDSDPGKAEQYKHWREMSARLNKREEAQNAL